MARAPKEWGRGSAGSWVARRYAGMPLCPLGRAFGSAADTAIVDRLAGEWSPAWGLLSFSERDWTNASTPPTTLSILFLTLRLRGEMFYALLKTRPSRNPFFIRAVMQAPPCQKDFQIKCLHWPLATIPPYARHTQRSATRHRRRPPAHEMTSLALAPANPFPARATARALEGRFCPGS